jgi:hypothetical protein
MYQPNFDLEDMILNEEYEKGNFMEGLRKCSDKELKEAVLFCMNSENYEADTFTPMIENIVKYDSFRGRQRDVLMNHLYYHQ